VGSLRLREPGALRLGGASRLKEEFGGLDWLASTGPGPASEGTLRAGGDQPAEAKKIGGLAFSRMGGEPAGVRRRRLKDWAGLRRLARSDAQMASSPWQCLASPPLATRPTSGLLRHFVSHDQVKDKGLSKCEGLRELPLLSRKGKAAFWFPGEGHSSLPLLSRPRPGSASALGVPSRDRDRRTASSDQAFGPGHLFSQAGAGSLEEVAEGEQ